MSSIRPAVRSKSAASRCPCESGVAYSACCKPLHTRAAAAETAERLMRSRYSAYVKRLPAYLLETWHPSTRPATLDLDARQIWLGLEVVGAEAGGVDEDTGTVEFVARWRFGEAESAMREVSRFERVDGRWRYLDGDVDPGAGWSSLR